MNTTHAQQLATSLMNKHGLDGWRFRFSRGLRQLGCCNYRNKTISLSRVYVERHGEEQVRDTILHEIAHALTPGAGHGWVWKAKCLELGCRPQVYAQPHEVKMPTWKTFCTSCGKVTCTSYGKRRNLHRRQSNCCCAPVDQRREDHVAVA